jgi:hypothetical protein
MLNGLLAGNREEGNAIEALSLTLLKQEGNKSGKSYTFLGATCYNFSE